jgi:hypothetical protein
LKGWFSGLFRNKDLVKNNQGPSYFEYLELVIRACTGDGQGGHTEISRIPIPHFGLLLSPDVWGKANGDPEELLKYRTSLDRPKHPPSCWREREGTYFCLGSSEVHRICVSLPIVLNFYSESRELRHWTFPSIIQLSLPEGDPIVYDICTRVFYNGGHYTTRFRGYTSATSSTIYDYDGMRFGGFSKDIENSSPDTHLCGADDDLEDCPAGYYTVLVTYRLRGGVEAQQRFFHQQLAQIASKFKLSWNDDTLGTLPIFSSVNPSLQPYEGDRIWKGNPLDLHTVEYMDRHVPDIIFATKGADPPNSNHHGNSMDVDSKTADGGRPGGPMDVDDDGSSSMSSVERSLLELIDPQKSKRKRSPLPDLSSDSDINQPHATKRQKTRMGNKRSHSPSADDGTDKKRIKTADAEPLLTIDSDKDERDYDCRCGQKGKPDRNVTFPFEEALQCVKCGKWSHLACQQGLNGKASRPQDVKFECHRDAKKLLTGIAKVRKSSRV